MTLHKLPPRFLRDKINIDLVGAGGNGSQMLTGLARLHIAMKALGHPSGLHVRVVDPDEITEANVGRQMFSQSDIGLQKATVLVQRVNLFFGLEWEAYHFEYRNVRNQETHMIIGCVDSAESRRSIHTAVRQSWDCYWLDLGNSENTGQVVLGRWIKTADAERQARLNQEATGDKEPGTARLPLVTELFPQLLDKKRVEDKTPSCSLLDALGRQDLFINQGVATFALNLLWRLFRFGQLDHHGYFINMQAGRVVPMPIDPEAWKRLSQTRSAELGAARPVTSRRLSRTPPPRRKVKKARRRSNVRQTSSLPRR